MTTNVPSIHCVFKNEESLYLAYMSFIKNSGLFIRTKTVYPLGSGVHLSVQLLEDEEVYLMEGKVVWVTPKGAQGNKPVGIGVQLMGENSRSFCNKIETYLAGMLTSSQPTDTI
jgi:type IV pilus assembly protein PilZ